MRWLLRNQNQDGSFGTTLPIPKEKLISTLGALLAIADLPQDAADGAHRARLNALRYLYEDTANWQTGPDKLTVASIGTGSYRDELVPDQLGVGKTAKIAYRALTSLMNDAQMFILMQMQYLGETLTPWLINSEVGTLAGDGPSQGKLFRFSLRWRTCHLADRQICTK